MLISSCRRACRNVRLGDAVSSIAPAACDQDMAVKPPGRCQSLSAHPISTTSWIMARASRQMAGDRPVRLHSRPHDGFRLETQHRQCLRTARWQPILAWDLHLPVSLRRRIQGRRASSKGPTATAPSGPGRPQAERTSACLGRRAVGTGRGRGSRPDSEAAGR